jgi:HEAT repeat protein
MSKPDIKSIALQLESSNSKDRLLALASLREVAPEEAVPLIKKVLYDEMLPVRSMAVFALGVKQTEECFPILVDLLANDADYDIRAFEPLQRAFYEDTQWLVRFSAAVALGNLGDIRAKQVLLSALDSNEAVIQQAAIAALGEIKAVETVEKLLTFVNSDDWLIRQRLAEALGQLPAEKTIAALKFLVKDEHPQVREAARLSLQKLANV